MSVNAKSLNLAKLSLFTTNVINFFMVSYFVIGWMSNLVMPTPIYVACIMLSLIIAWVPVVSTGFFLYFIYYIGVTAPLLFLGAALPLLTYFGITLFYKNRIVVPSKI
ncbi:hypothetical protein [Vibrio sp. THAF190c]|uniref:hypothetical protein n=1 Tax=Vibrio sp. THAF190c TaxID=2587865 RepID=UPI001267D1D1|nr:hypothetical protein [Vibrio sp. THAF190c]QFT13296.1 hypothetical protein FIV04_25435 [Vibrio sp. THAF190c]